MAGVRIHDYTHPSWKKDVDIILSGIGEIVSYITIPKQQLFLRSMKWFGYIKNRSNELGIEKAIPIHISC